MNASVPTTLAFNLRLTPSADAGSWRITLYDAHTGTYRYFTSLPQLDAFLHRVTHTASSAAPDPSAPVPRSGTVLPGTEPPDRAS